jgi:hypothetical protein
MMNVPSMYETLQAEAEAFNKRETRPVEAVVSRLKDNDSGRYPACELTVESQTTIGRVISVLTVRHHESFPRDLTVRRTSEGANIEENVSAEVLGQHVRDLLDSAEVQREIAEIIR